MRVSFSFTSGILKVLVTIKLREVSIEQDIRKCEFFNTKTVTGAFGGERNNPEHPQKPRKSRMREVNLPPISRDFEKVFVPKLEFLRVPSLNSGDYAVFDSKSSKFCDVRQVLS